jgi:NADPH-dependent curcumin reductase CurA
MNDAKSYAPSFQLNQPIEGSIIASVTESKSANFKAGDLIVGRLPWQTEFIAEEKNLQKIDASVAPASYYLGVLGMTGLTAYLGLSNICKPKAGEAIVISGAAGAVGLIAGQIAKIHSCFVIGIAGSDEKIKLLKDKFGFDGAINYKTSSDLEKDITALSPKGVDMYFDNVGGKISDAVVNNINFHARIAICGQISQYNNSEIQMGPRLQPLLLTKSALMQGFIIGNYQKEFPDAILQLTSWVKEGKLKFTETIIQGFDKLPSALLGLFNGENTGKMIVQA